MDVSDARPITSTADLLDIFHAAEKPRANFRIGAEAEKFGVQRESGAPLFYDGEFGVTRLFAALQDLGWQPEREVSSGPVIALTRGQASITLEPGAQFELSGAPLLDVHAIEAEFEAHFAELEPIARDMNLMWLGVGFHPLARQADLPWVPKQRYAIMREYLPKKGAGAHDMMRRTATVQANFDFSDERDAMRKTAVMLRLSPILHAMTANSPFFEGELSKRKSERGNVWLHMDPSRSGLIPALWAKRELSYVDYVDWALDAGMFLIKREGQVLANTGQTFRDFLTNGFRGERATFGDWKLHLNTLFPEVRLKSTIEVRACDSLPAHLMPAVPALFTGILYDETALAQAEALSSELVYEEVEAARVDLVTNALAARIGKFSARALAERVFEISRGGLARRKHLNAAGEDETIYLDALGKLLERGQCPADQLRAGLPEGKLTAREIMKRSAMFEADRNAV